MKEDEKRRIFEQYSEIGIRFVKVVLKFRSSEIQKSESNLHETGFGKYIHFILFAFVTLKAFYTFQHFLFFRQEVLSLQLPATRSFSKGYSLPAFSAQLY